jgi:hypothetical protein
MSIRSRAPGPRPELNISLEKVCFVIAKARELDVKVAPERLDDASDEDMMQRILEDYGDDPTFEELRSFLLDQNDDELKELLALTWLGRGDFTIDEWRAGLRATCASTTRPTISSGRRCSPISLKKASRSLASLANDSSSAGYEGGPRIAAG